MIVTSLAGGFGSGVLIPLSLMIRGLSEAYSTGKTIITGVFISPESFISFLWDDLSLYEKDAMRANAYATLKELNMINEICMSKSPANDVWDMKIMDLFDSDKDKGNRRKIPFDEVLFVKSQYAKNDRWDFIDEVSNCLLTIVTSGLYASKKDANLALVPYGIYGDYSGVCGYVGSSCITYPYRFVVKYCCWRATIRELSDVWTLVDREIKNTKCDHSPESGDSRDNKESLGKLFVATVNSMLEDGNSKLGFIANAITDSSEDGSQFDKVDVYYDHVYNFVLDKIRSDEEIKTKSDGAGVTEKQLKDNLVTGVTRCETALKDYFYTIDSRIDHIRSLVVPVIPDDSGFVIIPDSNLDIMKLVTSHGHIVHPLAMRMLLYKFRAKVAEEYERSSSLTASYIEDINYYFKKAYDIKGTERIEHAYDRADQKGFFKQRKFRAEYLIKSADQKSLLDKYRDTKAIAVVFGDILERLDYIIDVFEKFFDSLDHVVKELQRGVEDLEKSIMKTEGSLYLSKPEIEEIYDSLDISSFEFNNSDIFEVIFNELYMKALHPYEYKHYGDNFFVEKIIPIIESNFTEAFSNKLNLDLFDVMEKVAEGDRGLEEKMVGSACQRATPPVAFAPIDLSICIVNNSLYEHLEMDNALSVFSHHCGVDTADCVSNKDAIFLREKSGLSFADIILSAEFTKCEEAYKLVLDKYKKSPRGNYCPHIDKRWCV